MDGTQDQESAVRHVSIYGLHDGKSARWELAVNENNPKDIEAVKLAMKFPSKKHRFARNVIIGDWDRDIVKIELDKKYSFRQAKAIAEMLLKRYGLEGYVILLSSNSSDKVWDKDYLNIIFKRKVASYHIVFNCLVSWSQFISILAWLSLRLKDADFDKWFKMQCVKQTCTLRHSCKGKKKPPKVIYQFGKQDEGISMFLLNQEFIHNLEGGEA
jgi:hypothetical protein